MTLRLSLPTGFTFPYSGFLLLQSAFLLFLHAQFCVFIFLFFSFLLLSFYRSFCSVVPHFSMRAAPITITQCKKIATGLELYEYFSVTPNP